VKDYFKEEKMSINTISNEELLRYHIIALDSWKYHARIGQETIAYYYERKLYKIESEMEKRGV